MTEHDVPEPASVAAGVVSEELVEAVVSDAAEGGVDLLGPEGVLAELTKRVLERALAESLYTCLCEVGFSYCLAGVSRPERRCV